MIKALNSLIRTDPFRTEMLAIYLVNVLFDESPMVRKEALQAIANLEKTENLKTVLKEFIEKEKDTELRKTAQEILGQ